MVGAVPDTAVAMTVSIGPRHDLIDDVHQIVVAACPGFDYGDARGRVRHEDV